MSSEKCNCTFCSKQTVSYPGLIKEVESLKRQFKVNKCKTTELTYEVLDKFLNDLNESLKKQSQFIAGYYCLTNGYQTTDDQPCNNPKCTCDKFKIKLEDIK